MRTSIASFVCAVSLAACGSSSSRGDAGGEADQDSGPAPLCPEYDAGWITSAESTEGYALIQQFGCQKCHGSILSGNNDGVQDPLSGNIEYPPNLTPDQATGLGCWSDFQVTDAILNNVDNQGNPICQPMPNFADAGMTVEDATAIVSYLRTIPAVSNPNQLSGPGCCLFDLNCGDNGYCFQRECIDGGPPTATAGATTGTSSVTSTAGTTGTFGTAFGATGTTGTHGTATRGHGASTGASTFGASTGATGAAATGQATTSSGPAATSAGATSSVAGTTGALTTAGTTGGLTTGAAIGSTGGTTATTGSLAGSTTSTGL